MFTAMAARAVLLLSAIAPVYASPNPQITAAAVLPRQLQSTIVGYYTFTAGGWGSAWCNPGWKYCTAGKFATCGTIVDAGCDAPVSCTSTSMYVDARGNLTRCALSTNTVCGTNYIYQTPGDPSPVTSIACKAVGANETMLYRSFPGAGISTGVPSSFVLSMPSSASPSSPSALSTPSSSSTSSATPTPAPQPAPASKAWIAGPVIGGLAAVAGIIAAIFFIRRRKSAARSTAQEGEFPPPGYHAAGYHEEKSPGMVHTAQPQYYQQAPQAPLSPQAPAAYRPVEMEAGIVGPSNVAELGPGAGPKH